MSDNHGPDYSEWPELEALTDIIRSLAATRNAMNPVDDKNDPGWRYAHMYDAVLHMLEEEHMQGVQRWMALHR